MFIETIFLFYSLLCRKNKIQIFLTNLKKLQMPLAIEIVINS